MANDLTAKSVAAAKPKNGKRTEIADGAVRGLYLVVQPSGAKSWAFRYRHPDDGRSRKLSLGSLDEWSLSQAREAARARRRVVDDGKDPAEVQREEYEAKRKAEAELDAARRAAEQDTFEKVLGRFADEKRIEKSPRYVDELVAMMRREVLPKFARRVIHEITADEITALIKTIAKTGKKTTANRTLVNLKVVFRWKGLSTLDGLKKPAPETERDRVLSDDEIRWFWQGCDKIGAPFGPMFKVLLLTGQRLREVSDMTAAELTKGGDWMMPAERAKNDEPHFVPLSVPVRDLLDGMTRIGDAGFIFTTTGKTPVSGYSRAKKNLDAEMAEIAGHPVKPWRLHDLRRSAASGMAELRTLPHVIEKVLNHRTAGSKDSVRGLAAVYNRYSYADEKRTALDAWARFVVQLVDGGGADNVVQLGAR